MRKPVATTISFNDGEVIDYAKRGHDLIVEAKAWNAERLLVRFRGMAALRDLGVGDISDLCEAGETTSLLTDVLDRLYDILPPDHGLQCFEFLDLDGEPVFEVVAEGVAVECGTEPRES